MSTKSILAYIILAINIFYLYATPIAFVLYIFYIELPLVFWLATPVGLISFIILFKVLGELKLPRKFRIIAKYSTLINLISYPLIFVTFALALPVVIIGLTFVTFYFLYVLIRKEESSQTA